MIYTDLQPSGFDQTSVSIDMGSQPMMASDSGPDSDGYNNVVLPGSNETTDVPE